MLQHITIWVSENWAVLASLMIAFVSLMIACIALFYAVRASNISKNAADAALTSDLIGLKLKANDSLTEIDRSFQVLQRNCNQTRADWDRHIRKHIPPLGPPSSRMPEQLSYISKVERNGTVLLQNAKQNLAGIEELNTTQLACKLAEIRTTAIEIEGLVAQLEGPPNYFN